MSMFAVCFMIQCANVCAEIIVNNDASYSVGEFKIINYDEECLRNENK